MIRGVHWGEDDQVVFGSASRGLFRVSGRGGLAEPLTTPDAEAGETSHSWPFVIRGRGAILFVRSAGSPLANGELAVLDLSGGEPRSLGLQGVRPHYVPTGHLVYAARDGSLRAAPFDVASLEVTGNAVPLVEGMMAKASGAVNFGLSENGHLVYATSAGGSGLRSSFVWVDRVGAEAPVDAEADAYVEFDLAPDGNRVAVRVAGDDRRLNLRDAIDPAIWILDLVRGTRTRLTFGTESVAFPTWTPDGTRVAFGPRVAWKRADGTGEIERLGDVEEWYPQAFGPDERALVVGRPGTDHGLAMLSLDGDHVVTPLPGESLGAALSADGRWLAYTSEESGQREVYVRPFPDVDHGRWQISTDGGEWPIWSPAADELFYRGATGVMGVAFDADPPTFTAGTPIELFERPIVGNRGRRMAVSPDGQRFLLLQAVDPESASATPARLHLVINWFEELKARVPVD